MNDSSQTAEGIHLLPYADDPLLRLTERLLSDHAAELPRLDKVTILLPDLAEAARLRKLLLQQATQLGHHALLGPKIESWRSWLSKQPLEDITTASDYRRELILLEALREHGELFGEANLWALADSLLTLFDELTLASVELPANLGEFTACIADGYGLPVGQHDALDREAQLVHTLWHAWHQELHTRGLIDRNTRYLLQLGKSLNHPTDERLYLLAPPTSHKAERTWLAEMLKQERLTLLLHGHYHGTPPRPYHPEWPLHRLLDSLGDSSIRCPGQSSLSQLLDTALAPTESPQQPIRQRAETFSANHPQSPAAENIYAFAAESHEEEARAVELQVRRWLLQGCQRVGIVTENRRLARRVRALLERAGITLEDTAGWALSTTSAAATMERWLQCVEEDFPHQAMLDLLKSPFFFSSDSRADHLQTVFRFEQDIVLHENIGSNIERYLQHLHYRQKRLPGALGEHLTAVAELLEGLRGASSPLLTAVTATSNDAGQLLSLLLESLDALGITPQLTADAAGMRLLEELEKMQQAVSAEPLRMNWLEFRSWLGRSFERYSFQPQSSGQVVTLSGLSQTPLARFDALIIAAVEREHLPGTPSGTPFFNDAVRQELRLPVADERLADSFHHFRRLLEAAPRLLLTHRQHDNGEEVPSSPWLELLQAFHRLAYGKTLEDLQLGKLSQEEMTLVVDRSRSLPSQSSMPRPQLTPSLLPTRYSASAYQQLINCPYQFFASRALGLSPPEQIREALEKSDYGERVHLCLQAFHGDVDGLPGPYSGGWEARWRNDAVALLERISHAVFARDLEDNFLHRGWLQRWLEKIPEYIDWQMARAERWRTTAVEQKLEQQTPSGLTLHGRLDRCDSEDGQLAIIDYKTGSYADDEEVLSGEAVQLPFYALLAEGTDRSVEEVSYLSLDKGPVASRSTLEGAELDELRRANGQRLESLHQQMGAGITLPAWGDSKSCNYCRMAGICRRQAWDGQ